MSDYKQLKALAATSVAGAVSEAARKVKEKEAKMRAEREKVSPFFTLVVYRRIKEVVRSCLFLLPEHWGALRGAGAAGRLYDVSPLLL